MWCWKEWVDPSEDIGQDSMFDWMWAVGGGRGRHQPGLAPWIKNDPTHFGGEEGEGVSFHLSSSVYTQVDRWGVVCSSGVRSKPKGEIQE